MILGKIYKIVSTETNKVYIGYTTDKTLNEVLQYFKYRYDLYMHLHKIQYLNAFELYKHGFNTLKIHMINTINTDHKKDIVKMCYQYRYTLKNVIGYTKCVKCGTKHICRKDKVDSKEKLLKSKKKLSMKELTNVNPFDDL